MLVLKRYSAAGMRGAALLLALALLMGCEEDVNPVVGTDHAFTVYGFFNPKADTQAVRLFNIEGRLEPTRPEPLDARVISVDLQQGDQRVWEDSVVQFAAFSYGHVYWSKFRAAFEHRYRLEVQRSDGVAAQVEVDVPPLSEPMLLTPTVAPAFVRIPVLWQRAPRLNRIQVRYVTNCKSFDFTYGLDQEQVPGGSVATIRFSEDARSIFDQVIFIEACNVRDLRLIEVRMTVLVTNEGWFPPTGVYDPELLVEPGTFSNVENGFGFVGAGYPTSFTWTPPDSIITAAGFFIDDGG